MSDGVIEARDAGHLFYQLTDRAPSWSNDDPDEFLCALHDDLLAHVHDHLDDDAAAVAIRRLAL
ncbi:SpoIIE family protein phosphatase [Streptomyces sp. NPDC051172]|uniref:SpoIIE family protein phosphatase n=1 Tax=Streptomyces sp. NPDC051172 TaxID=3155796 RepID=UPI003438ED78